MVSKTLPICIYVYFQKYILCSINYSHLVYHKKFVFYKFYYFVYRTSRQSCKPFPRCVVVSSLQKTLFRHKWPLKMCSVSTLLICVSLEGADLVRESKSLIWQLYFLSEGNLSANTFLGVSCVHTFSLIKYVLVYD